jgi:prepilin-type processing-associated H-X9-DG protein
LVVVFFPAWVAAKEKGRRAHCQSNLHQIGVAIQMYAGDYNDNIPQSRYDGGQQNVDYGYDAYLGTLTQSNAWGLGQLFEAKAAQNGQIFYCLSGKDVKGQINGSYADPRSFERYSAGPGKQWPYWELKDDGTYDDPGPTQSRVRTGYTYWPQNGMRTTNTVSPSGKTAFKPQAAASKATELSGRFTMLTDLIYRLDMVTHRSGVKRGVGVNALFGDGHLRFQKDPALFDLTLWNDTQNGQGQGGGIEDRGDNFHWVINAMQP